MTDWRVDFQDEIDYRGKHYNRDDIAEYVRDEYKNGRIIPYEMFEFFSLNQKYFLRDRIDGDNIKGKWNRPFIKEYPNGQEILKTIYAYIDKITNKILSQFDTHGFFLFDIESLHGKYFLLKALDIIEKDKFTVLKRDNFAHEKSYQNLAFHILVSTLPEKNDLDAIIEDMKKYSQQTLLLGGAIATFWRPAFEKALKMPGYAEFMLAAEAINTGLIRTNGKYREDDWREYGVFEIPVIPDLRMGKIDMKRIKNAAEILGKKNLDLVMKSLYNIRDGKHDIPFMLEAVFGTNEKEVKERFAKRNHVAVRALGVLPDKKSVKARYFKIKDFMKEAKEFGQMRQVTERAAGKVALENLAQVLGYDDSLRLEWSIASQLDQEYVKPVKNLKIENYQVSFHVDGARPVVEVINTENGKEIKSVPSKISKNKKFLPIKESTKIINQLGKQYRSAFERFMCAGTKIPIEELKILRELILVRQILDRIVMIDSNDQTGFLEIDKSKLMTLDGKSVSIGKWIMPAHPLDLLRLGRLSSAQKTIVEKKIKQPFKQIFRETYVCTSQEKKTKVCSERYKGTTFNFAQASAILVSRGWAVYGGDFPFKDFMNEEIRATIEFDNYNVHFMAEADDSWEIPTLKSISFTNPNNKKTIDLTDIPPRIFSEVMRDLDLLVSVAGRSQIPQKEVAVEYRVDLLRNILDSIKVDNVSLEPPYLNIDGKINKYRVDIVTKEVYKKPNKLICIVPTQFKRVRSTEEYLPFEESDDDISEILSKMFLLLEDDKIKDKEILKQLN